METNTPLGTHRSYRRAIVKKMLLAKNLHRNIIAPEFEKLIDAKLSDNKPIQLAIFKEITDEAEKHGLVRRYSPQTDARALREISPLPHPIDDGSFKLIFYKR